MSASAFPNGLFNTVFIRYDNGLVYEHEGKDPTTGFRRIDSNAVSISSGSDSQDARSVYIVYDNTALYEWSPNFGFHAVDANVAQVSAGHRDTVFILYQSGVVAEHVGLSASSGFTVIDSNATQISEGSDKYGNSSVWIVHTDSSLTEWSPAEGMTFTDWNVAKASAGAFGDQVYILYNDGEVYEHSGNSAGNPPEFTPIYVHVLSRPLDIAAGEDFPANDSVFIRFADSTLWQWNRPTGFKYIDSNVIGIAGVQDNTDNVYIIYNNSELFEYVGSDCCGNTGFFLVSPNVSP
jgi:hypothetical protein